jgi:hypothetical protein
MRGKWSVLFILALVLSLPSLAAAHDPPGELFFLVQFPDDRVPTVDGDHSDWNIVPDNPYTVRSDKLFDPAQFQAAGRGEFDPSDVNVRHRLGWNDSQNKIYFATEIFDNIHNTDREDPARHWNDDNWEVGVNPDHTPSEEHSRNVDDIPINDFFYKWVVPPVGGIYQSLEPIGDLEWLQDGTEYVQFGWSFTGEQFGESTYFYELSVIPIWALPRENATPENTDFMDLEENDVIHISIAMGDIDNANDYQGFWTFTAESSNTSVSDFVAAPLDPNLGEGGTAVEGTTWGAIKAGFVE